MRIPRESKNGFAIHPPSVGGRLPLHAHVPAVLPEGSS